MNLTCWQMKELIMSRENKGEITRQDDNAPITEGGLIRSEASLASMDMISMAESEISPIHRIPQKWKLDKISAKIAAAIREKELTVAGNIIEHQLDIYQDQVLKKITAENIPYIQELNAVIIEQIANIRLEFARTQERQFDELNKFENDTLTDLSLGLKKGATSQKQYERRIERLTRSIDKIEANIEREFDGMIVGFTSLIERTIDTYACKNPAK